MTENEWWLVGAIFFVLVAFFEFFQRLRKRETPFKIIKALIFKIIQALGG